MHSFGTLLWHGVFASIFGILASLVVFGTLALLVGHWFGLQLGPETPCIKALRRLQKRR